jgi:hypothetical protein
VTKLALVPVAQGAGVHDLEVAPGDAVQFVESVVVPTGVGAPVTYQDDLLSARIMP